VGFVAAYALASVAVIGLISAYGRVVLGGVRRAAALAIVAAWLLLFGFVSVDIDDSLLVASLGLFAMLASFMALTRRLDWYEISLPGSRIAAADRAEGAADSHS